MERRGSNGEDTDDRRRYVSFDIPPRGANIDNLKRERRNDIVLNRSRRYRCTQLFKKENEKEKELRKIRARPQALRAAYQFKEDGARKHTSTRPMSLPELLILMSREQDYSALEEYGGIKQLVTMLKTDIERGISGDESDVSKRRALFGSNTLPRKKGRNFLVFLWEACQDLTLVILMMAALISLVLGIKTEGIKEGWYDGASIASAVILVIFVTATSDYRESLQFQNLNEEKQNIHLEVIRGGRRSTVSIYDIVVGDVVPLKIGDQVPADGICISGHSLAIYESSMTGESKIFLMDQRYPLLMAGCKVADGFGTMLVTAVGTNTEWGLFMERRSEDDGEESPLQVRLYGVAAFIGAVGLFVAAAILVVLIVRYFSGHTKNADGTIQYIKGLTSTKQAINCVLKILTVAVTIVVVAVPEGLPLAVTLTRAYSMRKLMSDKALMRTPSACETMGSVTTILGDKTGTITLNEMTVVEAYFGGENIEYLKKKSSHVSDILISLLIEGIAQNTSGSVFIPGDGKEIEITGSPTEKAILSWGLQLGMIFNEERAKSTILHAYPFNSEKKLAGVAVHVEGSEVHLHWKGAAEIVLSCCTCWLDSSGLAQSMTPEKMEEIKNMIEGMAEAGLRCIAFAYRPFEIEKMPKEDERFYWSIIPENELVLLGIVGIKNSCRPGVKDAVELCLRAGVKVRMVTGDNIKTAKAIALECRILTDPEATEPTLIEGRVFRSLSDAEREEVAEKISVMGRSSPNDKLLLVKALRSRGHVVAVTVKGTDDAPALIEADIGLSMGIQGTAVAKESSDIIILDDNFASVVKVVRWGRSIYANIQKFIQFQLTVNIAALVINVVAAVSTGNLPLNAVQLLWVNLIMDTLGALAFAMEPPNDNLMNRPPVGRREPLVTNIMWRNLFVQALYQIAVILTLNFRGQNILGLENDNVAHAEKVNNMFIFNTFVFCQVFNEFNSRKQEELNIFEGIMQNHLFIGIIGITTFVQVLIIEFLGKFTSTVRLSWKLWCVSLAIAFFSWLLAVVGKLIPVPYRPLGVLLYSCFPKKRDLPVDHIC